MYRISTNEELSLSLSVLAAQGIKILRGASAKLPLGGHIRVLKILQSREIHTTSRDLVSHSRVFVEKAGGASRLVAGIPQHPLGPRFMAEMLHGFPSHRWANLRYPAILL